MKDRVKDRVKERERGSERESEKEREITVIVHLPGKVISCSRTYCGYLEVQ